MPVTSSSAQRSIVVYDEDCFFCSNYVSLMNLKTTLGGDVTLISARDKEKVAEMGLDPQMLNEGMLFITEGKRYWGADAIHHIALLSTPSKLFNRINYTVFRYRWLSRLLYPFLKLGRRAYLFLAGKDIIR